jgi:hypothetical protein
LCAVFGRVGKPFDKPNSCYILIPFFGAIDYVHNKVNVFFDSVFLSKSQEFGTNTAIERQVAEGSRKQIMSAAHAGAALLQPFWMMFVMIRMMMRMQSLQLLHHLTNLRLSECVHTGRMYDAASYQHAAAALSHPFILPRRQH